MNERKIHTMWKMIAIRDGDKVLAVFQSAFGELTDTLLSDLDQLERISFKMAASSLSTTAKREHYLKMPQWEALFLTRLKSQMATIGHLLNISVEGDEIIKYLPDILESYRGNHIGEFGFEVDELHGHDQSVLTLSTYNSPGIMTRLFRSERSPRQRINILRSDIKSITGTSLRLWIKTAGRTLELGPSGNISERSDT